MALLLMQALMMSGVSFTRGIQAFSPCKKAALVSFDVCGHGAPSGTAGNIELPPFLSTSICLYIPAFKVYPPTPDMAVATADAGETEKPPKT
jgi:hypothetical protein